MINIPNGYVDKKMRHNEITQFMSGQLAQILHSQFGVENITLISSAGPNNLVPKGLIYNEASGKLFEYLKSKGVKFYLDTEKKTEKGYSNNEGMFIFLGLKTPRSYTKDMGIDDNFDEDTKTQIVFLHEMCHHLARELFGNLQDFKKLFEICVALRSNRPKDGVSKLADMNFYYSRGIKDQATEDCVELLRIYFMYRKNESKCFECIKNKLHLNDDRMCKTIFKLLSESIIYKFPTR